jgi:hypothetical protein
MSKPTKTKSIRDKFIALNSNFNTEDSDITSVSTILEELPMNKRRRVVSEDGKVKQKGKTKRGSRDKEKSSPLNSEFDKSKTPSLPLVSKKNQDEMDKLESDDDDLSVHEKLDVGWMCAFSSEKKERKEEGNFDDLLERALGFSDEKKEGLKSVDGAAIVESEENAIDGGDLFDATTACANEEPKSSAKKASKDKMNDNMELTKEQKPFVRRMVNEEFFRFIKFLPRASSSVAASVYSDMVDAVVDQAGIGISGDDVAPYVKDIKKQIRYFTCQKRNTVVQQLQMVVKSKYIRAGLL